MIVFELICTKHHRFEGWFGSAGDFDSQKHRGLLSCPVCSNTHIEKLPTAKIGKAEARQPEAEPVEGGMAVPASSGIRPGKLNELIDFVLMNTENVGTEFSTEARRIHKQEVPQRNIRGVATRAETEELLEEGIQVMSLPIPPRGDWH